MEKAIAIIILILTSYILYHWVDLPFKVKETNEKLDKIIEILKRGNNNVK